MIEYLNFRGYYNDNFLSKLSKLTHDQPNSFTGNILTKLYKND